MVVLVRTYMQIGANVVPNYYYALLWDYSDAYVMRRSFDDNTYFGSE
jgi:hypothetical protein